MNTKEIRKKKILVVGDIILDRFIYGDASRISPEAPVPVVKMEKEFFSPGGAANVAVNLASVGANVVLCGTLGDDYYGNFAIEEFEKKRISAKGIIKSEKVPTTIKTRIIARKQQLVRLDREKINETNPERFIPFLKKEIKETNAVIIADYGKGMITKKLLEFLIPLASKNGKIITVDPQTEHFFRYKNVTTLTPNHFEVAKALGIKTETDEEVKRAGFKILGKLNAKSLVITRGEKGMAVFKGKKVLNIPTVAKDVFDVTGAGDTVIAILTLSLSCGLNIFESAKIANRAAGIVVGKFGTAALSKKELTKCL
ncbi:MAG: D-glycero-beta-D-manno-heptose-7-phosphate kinase [Elusimicrobia bacterium]|nr:D-glycero-beta-D-manno-heptose-7-phosphate kinase [Elusimicrobiota bacterium]